VDLQNARQYYQERLLAIGIELNPSHNLSEISNDMFYDSSQMVF